MGNGTAGQAPGGGRARWVEVARALLIGAAGGAVCALLALPLPWMLGAMAATTVASFGGVGMEVPDRLRRPMISVLGIMLGTTFTPDRLDGVLGWLPTLLTLPLYVAVVGCVILAYLRRFADFDATTAFFAATPGGLSEMIAMSDQMGGDMRRVSLVHATRLLFIVSTIPFVASWFGTVTVAASQGAASGVEAIEVVVLLVLGGAGYLLGQLVRLPAATFIGPLIGSTVATLAGWVELQPPGVVMAVAQLVLGSAVGVRFSGVPLAVIGRTLVLGFGAVLLMLLVTLGFVEILHLATGYSLALLLLAFMPGGFTEMSLIALAMGVDPAFVVTHHTARVFLVVLMAPIAFAWMRRQGWTEVGVVQDGQGGASEPR